MGSELSVPYSDLSLSVNVKTALIGAGALLLVRYLLKGRQRRKLPPGPRGLPYFGNAWAFSGNKYMHEQLAEWAKEYGDFYSVRLGHYDALILSSPESIRELLQHRGEATQNRMEFLPIFRIFDVTKGIINNIGASWREQRRTTLMSLREFGFGKRSLEATMQEEAQCIVSELDKFEDTPMNPQALFIAATMNTISSIVFGKRFSYDDADFIFLMEKMNHFFTSGGNQNVSAFFPESLIFFPVFMMSLKPLLRSIRQVEGFLMKLIDEHRKTFDPNNARDLVDLYIQRHIESPDNKSFSDFSLLATVNDLFLAGAETTSTLLTWAVLYLIHNQDIQDKCRKEIIEVIGASRQPVYADHNDMPYVEATIMEVNRRVTIVPLSVTHSTCEEIEYRGFIIPKDTILIPNTYAVHLDPKHWGDPEAFRPERWIDDAGKVNRNHPAYLPFGVGPRECMGKSLANQQSFIILCALLQHFKFTATDPDNLPSLRGQNGITMKPDDFLVKLEKI